MAYNDHRTHAAPYYGGEKFHRTLQEAFGPYTNHVIYPTERPSLLQRVRDGFVRFVIGLAAAGIALALLSQWIIERVAA